MYVTLLLVSLRIESKAIGTNLAANAMHGTNCIGSTCMYNSMHGT